MFELHKAKYALNREVYRDKVLACWIGKNIGGTMGGPYEGKREILDVQGFITKEGEVLPNDDLDLQLVWLHMIQEVGPYNLNEKMLGEAWLSYITPHWAEYGLCRANMERGLPPPLSGDFLNDWQNSNGAWIRTEVFATLCPAAPAAAMKYARMDACVDHGTGEGTAAAIFVAAIESAAFVVDDLFTLIKIGLAAVPEESRVARTVRLALDLYEKKTDWRDARNAIQKENADIGNGWFEAPSNIGYVVLGLLYGEGDFKKSMITAINCGDDTDCTAATVGSILGIMHGTAGIPADWRKHIGDQIVTICIAGGVFHHQPRTCTELTDLIVETAPHVLFANRAPLSLTDGESVLPEKPSDVIANLATGRELCNRPKNSFTQDMSLMQAEVVFPDGVTLTPNGTCPIDITFTTKPFVRRDWPSLGNIPLFMEFEWHMPEGFSIEGPSGVRFDHRTPHCDGEQTVSFLLHAPEKIKAFNRILLDVTFPTRHLTDTAIGINLLG